MYTEKSQVNVYQDQEFYIAVLLFFKKVSHGHTSCGLYIMRVIILVYISYMSVMSLLHCN